MEHIQSSIFYDRRMPNPHLNITAKIQTSGSLVQDARWGSRLLKIGDEVCIRLTECNKPDPPEKLVSFGSKLHPTEPLELFCSFCGRSQHDVKKMISGAGGNACDECIKLLNKTLEQEQYDSNE